MTDHDLTPEELADLRAENEYLNVANENLHERLVALRAENKRLRDDFTVHLLKRRWVESERDRLAAVVERVLRYADEREAYGRQGRTVHSARIASDLRAIANPTTGDSDDAI